MKEEIENSTSNHSNAQSGNPKTPNFNNEELANVISDNSKKDMLDLLRKM